MKCECCDRLLSDYESTLKHAVSEEYTNTCLKCLEGLGIPTRGRFDLSKKVPDEEAEDVEFNDFTDSEIKALIEVPKNGLPLFPDDDE